MKQLINRIQLKMVAFSEKVQLNKVYLAVSLEITNELSVSDSNSQSVHVEGPGLSNCLVFHQEQGVQRNQINWMFQICLESKPRTANTIVSATCTTDSVTDPQVSFDSNYIDIESNFEGSSFVTANEDSSCKHLQRWPCFWARNNLLVPDSEAPNCMNCKVKFTFNGERTSLPSMWKSKLLKCLSFILLRHFK